MDKGILLGWVAYLVSVGFLLLAGRKLVFFLPRTLRFGLKLSVALLLLWPASVAATGSWAPAFVVLLLDAQAQGITAEWLERFLPLALLLLLVWPVAWGLSRNVSRREQAASARKES